MTSVDIETMRYWFGVNAVEVLDGFYYEDSSNEVFDIMRVLKDIKQGIDDEKAGLERRLEDPALSEGERAETKTKLDGVNMALRNLAKLMSNALTGKFLQRDDFKDYQVCLKRDDALSFRRRHDPKTISVEFLGTGPAVVLSGRKPERRVRNDRAEPPPGRKETLVGALIYSYSRRKMTAKFNALREMSRELWRSKHIRLRGPLHTDTACVSGSLGLHRKLMRPGSSNPHQNTNDSLECMQYRAENYLAGDNYGEFNSDLKHPVKARECWLVCSKVYLFKYGPEDAPLYKVAWKGVRRTDRVMMQVYGGKEDTRRAMQAMLLEAGRDVHRRRDIMRDWRPLKRADGTWDGEVLEWVYGEMVEGHPVVLGGYQLARSLRGDRGAGVTLRIMPRMFCPIEEEFVEPDDPLAPAGEENYDD
jgi:hypothetical protein